MRAMPSSLRARSSSEAEGLSVDSRAAVPPPSTAELPRRVDKPWGHELIWAHTDRYVGKILQIHREDPGRIHVVMIRRRVGF